MEKESYLLELSRYVVLNPVRAGVGLPGIWNDLRGQIYLGKEEFVKTMQQHVQSANNISEIPRAQRRAKAKPLTYYSSFNDRNAGIAAAYQTGDYTMKAIVDEFGLQYANMAMIRWKRRNSQAMELAQPNGC